MADKPSWLRRFTKEFINGLKKLGNRISKLFDKVIYNQKAAFVVSGLFAVIFCVSISYDDLRYSLFNKDSTTLTLPNVPVEAIYDENSYEVSGLPAVAEMVVEGDQADLQLVRTQNSASIQANLTNLAEGTNTVTLVATGLPNGVTASINPATADINIEKKLSKTFFISPELLIGDNQTEGQFEKPVLASRSVTIKATSEQLNSIRSVKAIIDTAGRDSDFTTEASLVAYDSNGRQVNVEMNPSTVEATVKVKTPDTNADSQNAGSGQNSGNGQNSSAEQAGSGQ